MANLLFYLLSAAAVLSAIGVIAARSPVASVVSLLGTFFSLAVIYLLAGFQFMAAVQVLVYAGAIMVLFLFVVMLLGEGELAAAVESEPIFRRGRGALLATAVALALMGVGLFAVATAELAPLDPEAGRRGIDSALGLAEWMFVRYSLPFEAASLLLLATAVGVLVLAKRQRPGLPGATSRTGEGGAA